MTSLALALTLLASPLDYDQIAKDARAVLTELVAADTTNPPGNEARAVAILARHLREAGIPYEITTFEPGRDNLVARIKGDQSRKPILLLAHTDVVGTDNQTWTSPPHTVTERDGYLYGRGVSDDLGMASINLAVALAIAKAKVPLKRDLIVAYTGNEESGGSGIRWQVANRPDTLQAELAFNEGGGPLLNADGKVELVALQCAQKQYQDFVLTAVGVTGHSSMPPPENAIVDLAKALHAIGDYRFPERLTEITRPYFAARGAIEGGPLGAAMVKLASARGELPAKALETLRRDPAVEALLHSTCVATLVSGGTRQNALPASATANVNCRLMPDEPIAQVQARLQQLAGPRVTVAPAKSFGSSAPAPLEGLGPEVVKRASEEMWPGIKVVPSMIPGGTDTRVLLEAGIPAYGVWPFPAAEADHRRHHGVDERLSIAGLRSGVELLERMVRVANE